MLSALLMRLDPPKQSCPPCAAGVDTFRKRSVIPPPQDFVQALPNSEQKERKRRMCSARYERNKTNT